MPHRRSRPLNLEDFDAIDWDPVEAEGSNLAKCMSRGIDEIVVWEVLGGDWIDVEMPVNTAEFVVVGPNEERNRMWTLLFATSSQRGDWLRPVTGWPSDNDEITEWQNQTGLEWKMPGKRRKRRTEAKGGKMSEEQRHDEEIRRAAKAEVGAGRVVTGSGRRGKPRRMAQMVSVRLDGELVGKLRVVAKERNVTLSDLLREGAELIVEDEYAGAQLRASFTITGAQDALRRTTSGRELAAH